MKRATLVVSTVVLLLTGSTFAGFGALSSSPSEPSSGVTAPLQNEVESSQNSPAGLNKLMDAEAIIGPLEQGAQTVEVVISLAEPARLRVAAPLETRVAVENRQREVGAILSPVLSALAPSHVRVRHILENQATFSAEITPEGLAQLLNDPRVESIEPVYFLNRLTAQGIPLMNATVHRQTYNGQGVSIAMIDDAVDYKHPKLGGRAFPNSKVIGGYDFGESDADPAPSNGDRDDHGTHSAGVAAGDLGNTGDYIGGVAYGASLYALKVARSDGNIPSTAVLRAVDWCVSHKNDDPQRPILVISISLGSGRYNSRSKADAAEPSYAQAVRNALSVGITVVAASGNEGYCDSIGSPAALTGVLAVGAVYDAAFEESRFPCVSAESCVTKYPGENCAFYAIDHPRADLVPSYSNTATFLDILAPANRAHTLDVVGPQGASADDYYPNFGGTSAACPYAAGAVACLQSASKAVNGRYLSPAEVRAILTSTGDSITDTKPTPRISTPRINLGKAITSLIPTPVSSSVVIDDMERYTEEVGKEIFSTWIDGYADNYTSSRSTVGLDVARNGTFGETTIVHGGWQSMPMDYDNSSTPFYSEAVRTFSPLQDWTANGVTALSLWVRGYSSGPSFAVTETGGRMSLTGDGVDIWGTADEFVYAYKTLTGNGSIVARVTSNGTGSDTWAKGGVMIRDSLDPGSTHAMQIITGGAGNGASFQWRRAADGSSSAINSPVGVAPPYWVKIERVGNTLMGSLSSDGVTWWLPGPPQTIAMTAPVYIGICVTSHAAGEPRTFQFDNISTSGGVSGVWQGVEITPDARYNSAQPLYVAVEDSDFRSILRTNATAVNTTTWTEWRIPLSTFTGVNLAKIKKLYIGVGNKNNPTADGSGRIYVDDICLSSTAGGYITPVDPGRTNLVGCWSFDEGVGTVAADSSGNGNNGTLTGGPTWDLGKFGKAVKFDGVDDYVLVPHKPILCVSNEVTVMAWVNTSRYEYPGGGYQGIIAKGNAPRSYSLYTDSSGRLHFSIGPSSLYNGSTSTGTVPQNQWVHVCAIAMAKGSGHRYSINGVAAGSGGSSVGGLPGTNDTANVVIGRSNEGANRSWGGLIDDVRIYNRALSGAEILWLAGQR